MAFSATVRELDKSLVECTLCPLNRNCHKIPERSLSAKYMMVTEFPYRQEPHFIKDFWTIAKEYQLFRDDFVCLSAVQCYPDTTKEGGKGRVIKPSTGNLRWCRKWLDEYALEFNPEKMLVFGNLSMQQCMGLTGGITDKNAMEVRVDIGKKIIPAVLSVNPSVLLTGTMGGNQIAESLKTFKEMK